jgi:uracil-DNA glycosylase
MDSAALADRLISTLPPSRETLFNPWKSRCEHDLESRAPMRRRERLTAHLDCDARLILVGEAVGYQGGRYSGIAFTSERLVGEGRIPRVNPAPRLTRRPLPFSEPSATIVWRELESLGLHEHTILWNALPMHPHAVGRPWSNRTPTRAEFALGREALRMLVEAYPRTTVVAVGRHAEAVLGDVLDRPIPGVRHPAYGGASQFSCGLRSALSRR